MWKSFVWLGGAGLLVLGCGDDSGVTPGDESSSGAETTTSPLTTSGPADSSSSGVLESSSGGTTAEASTTAMGESSEGPGAQCGNGVIEDGEVCDGTELGGEACATQGFDFGELLCADGCDDYVTAGCSFFSCGDGVAEGKETCDSMDFGGATCQSEGFDNGTLSCSLDCSTLRTDGCGICGNYIVEDGEVCDQFLTLGEHCESQGFHSGQLLCMPDCLTYDTSGCGTCGNGIVDGAELCDGAQLEGESCTSIGYDSGTLACSGSCLVFDTVGCGTCGNGVIDGDELCDGPSLAGASCQTEGFDNGTLACAPDCYSYVTAGCGTCGNAVIDGSESCDGDNLGGETCVSLGLTGGTLTCSPGCQFDASTCDIPGLPFGSDSGYTGYEITGAPLPCDDISGTGTGTGLLDDENAIVPIGFTFTFYGVGYTDINIQSNGAVNFGTVTEMSLANGCLPTATVPNTNNLYVFWDDLNPGAAGASEVYYQTLGAPGERRLVVQWETAHFGGDANDLIRVQAMFDEATGQISVCYPDTLSLANIGNNGAEATSGIQHSSVDGFDYSCNTPDLTNGLLLLYVPS